MISKDELLRFMRESLHIEGIFREPTAEELSVTRDFLKEEFHDVRDLVFLVGIYHPGVRLRREPGMNVRVGDYVAPPGGPEIEPSLSEILRWAPTRDPWRTHIAYERLHPFTDGNGRSGRALWAWQMVRRQNGLPLGFLHQWYYQTLAGAVPAEV